MVHASILTLIIALAVGLAVIALSALTYFQFRTRHLLAHLYLVTSINLIVLIYIATLYFYQNLLSEVRPSFSSFVDNANQILIPGLQATALASLIYLARLMLGVKNTGNFLRSYGCIFSSVVLLQVIFAIWQPYLSDMPVLYMTFRAVEVMTLLGAYVVLIVMSLRAKTVRPPAKGRSLRVYASLLLGLLSIVVLFNAAKLLNLITPSIYAFVGAVLVLAINLVPILYRRLFFAPGFNMVWRQNILDTVDIDVRSDFGISIREKEVLGLICEGKTNQEIADILFISLQTVKDHTSRIYKKVGVKNRVQLIAFLKNCDSFNR